MEEVKMKRTLSIMLVLILLMVMAIPVFAQAATGKITGMVDRLSLGYSGANGDYVDLGEVYPQDERIEYIYLYDSMFEWDGASSMSATPTQLSSSDIRNAKMTVKTTANSRIVESVTINSRESRIEVKFSQTFPSIKEQEFDFNVYLTIDGRRQSDYGISFSGTFCNPIVDVYGNDEHADVSDGSIAEAKEYVRSITFDVGNGAHIKTRMSNGKKLYCTTTRTPSARDDEVFTKYRALDGVITFTAIGLGSSSDKIELDSEYRDYFVYSADMKYLGKGNIDLEYSEKLYLSIKKLDIEDEFDKDESSVSTSSAGKDQSSTATEPVESAHPANVNHNPSTGR